MKLFESRLHEKRKWLEMSRELGVTTLGIRTMKPLNINELELNHANENTEYYEKRDSWFTRLLTWIGTYICWRDR